MRGVMRGVRIMIKRRFVRVCPRCGGRWWRSRDAGKRDEGDGLD